MSIPESLDKVIEEVVKSGRHGYRSKQDFVLDAIRRRLEQLGYLK